MKYDLSNQMDVSRLKDRLNRLFKKGSLVELTEKQERTSNQNRYLHLILSYFSMEYGCRLEYAKTKFFKREVNADIFIKEKACKLTGEIFEDLRSSKDLTKEEMSICIDRFLHWSAENFITLPNSEDEAFLREIEVRESREKSFL